MAKVLDERFQLVEFFCFGLGISIILVTFILYIASATKAYNDLIDQTELYLNGVVSLEKKIDFLTQLISICSVTKTLTLNNLSTFVNPVLIAFTCATVMPLTVYKMIELPNYRFLLFTELSKKERDTYFRNLADRKTFWVVTILFGLLIGILGNYIFTILSNIGK